MRAHTVRKILIVILAAVLALSVIGIARQNRYHNESNRLRDEAKDMLTPATTILTAPPVSETTAEITTAPPPETTVPTETTAETTAETTPAPITDDFATELLTKSLAALTEVNSDVIGWIEIPGTTVSYPLMQGEDNTHYLNYAWDGSYNPGGAIFLDYRSAADFSDFHTIVYGHRMYRDAMFNSLKNYSSLDYAQEHPYVYILLPDRVLRYTVFAAYDADAINGHSYRLGLTDGEGQQKYIDYCLKNSVLDTGITPAAAEGDCVLTLSTCSATGSEKTRWVTHWVLDAEFIKE